MRRDIYTEEHEAFRDLVREFIKREVTPYHAQWERDKVVSREVWLAAGRAGLLGIDMDEKFGGGGNTDYRYYAIMDEEFARAGATGLGFFVHNDMIGRYLDRLCTLEQRERWLPGYCSGELIAAIAMTEPSAGSDLQGIRTTAVRDGDHYVLNGQKTFISNGQLCDLVIVVARTDPAAGHRGISLLVVEAGLPGFTRGRNLDKVGMHAQDTAELFFSDVRVPVENRLGEEGDGFKIAMATLDFTRPGTAVGAVGVAQAAYEHAVAYAKERVTFDVPIAMHQGINFMIADMATEIEAARLLTWQAAWMLDQGYGRKATLYSSFAKRFAADTAMKVATDAVQVFGGYGYIKEYPVEKLMRDAKLFQIYEGTSQIQRLVIAKEIFIPRG